MLSSPYNEPNCACFFFRDNQVDAATVLGKGRRPCVNSKYCSSKLQHATWSLRTSQAGRKEETIGGRVGSVLNVEGYRRQWSETETQRNEVKYERSAVAPIKGQVNKSVRLLVRTVPMEDTVTIHKNHGYMLCCHHALVVGRIASLGPALQMRL